MKYKIIFSIIFVIILINYFLYINYDFKSIVITSLMTTKSHQYIARLLYSDSTIKNVMNNNRIISSNSSNYNLINIIDTDDLFEVKKIYRKHFRGYIAILNNPGNVHLEVSKDIGKSGELITSLYKRSKASVIINGGGFYDPEFESNGAFPHGVVIVNHSVVSNYSDLVVDGGFIGFNDDNKLILKKTDCNEATKIYRDALEFGPFLIVDGVSSKVIGNGGYGYAPRTAIGQTRDGKVIFLVIDGRMPSSVGASMKDMIDLFLEYDVVNAANLDGGSSSELLVNGKIINKVVGGGSTGLRKMPSFWVYKVE